ncbi:MAG TPA: PilZ domain-containing protein [Anaeromyxobacteraceae bacterium]|nr:PilZ domain-containing protein [Anaeromyxobacteraceae bacterium]
MGEPILNTRRALRVPARCRLRAEAGGEAWYGETEDIGPLGCRVVGPMPLPSGQPIRLAISTLRVDRLLEADGRVAWAGGRLPWRHGVAFDASAHARSLGWFDRLVGADPGLLADDPVPDRLAPEVTLYPGAAPRTLDGYGPDELAVLRKVGAGATAGELRARLTPGWDRSRRALFALIARRALTTAREAAGDPAAWARLLAGGARTPPPRRPEADEALDLARGALSVGRVEEARRLLRHALELAPGDPEIGTELRRALALPGP